MSGNGDMNTWIRQAMTPKHALEAFVALLAGQDTDPPPGDGQGGSQDAAEGRQAERGDGKGPQGAQDPPRRRVDANAGDGNRPENQPEAGGTSHQAMNRLLKDAVRGKDRG